MSFLSLSNGENKTRIIKLIFETLQRKKAAVLNTVRTTKITLSREDHCQSISLSSNDTFRNLLSNHEEADTKIGAHAMQFLEENENHRVVIRSPSGDTDILDLTASILYSHKTRIFLERNKNLFGLAHLSYLNKDPHL